MYTHTFFIFMHHLYYLHYIRRERQPPHALPGDSCYIIPNYVILY